MFKLIVSSIFLIGLLGFKEYSPDVLHGVFVGIVVMLVVKFLIELVR